MDWAIGNANKYYVDQQLPNYQALATALALQFPNLRVAIGPASLNDRYTGANKQQIQDFIDGFVPPARGGALPAAAAPKDSGKTASNAELARPNPAPPAKPWPGDKILVSMQGIGDVEAKFVKELPGGKVMIDLDGIEESVDGTTVRLLSFAEPEVVAAEVPVQAAKPPTVQPSEAPKTEVIGASAAAPEPPQMQKNAEPQANETIDPEPPKE